MDEKEEYISYRINTHTKYIVYKTSYGGRDYYKISFEKKCPNGSKIKIYRNLKFVNCIPPENGDFIRITKAFEDNYIDPKNKYNDVCIIVVQEYESFKNEEKMREDAYKNFHRAIEDGELYGLGEESLPF